MANPKKINLGVFMAGEIPFPFVHTFKNADGTLINLTGYTPSITFEGPEAGPYGQGTVQVTDAANGEVTYTWDPTDIRDIGLHQFLIWVVNAGPTSRLASDLVTYEVYDGPGATPT